MKTGATATANQQPHSRCPTPLQDRRIMESTRAQGHEARDRFKDREEGVKKRKEPQQDRSGRGNVENERDLSRKRK